MWARKRRHYILPTSTVYNKSVRRTLGTKVTYKQINNVNNQWRTYEGGDFEVIPSPPEPQKNV